DPMKLTEMLETTCQVGTQTPESRDELMKNLAEDEAARQAAVDKVHAFLTSPNNTIQWTTLTGSYRTMFATLDTQGVRNGRPEIRQSTEHMVNKRILVVHIDPKLATETGCATTLRWKDDCRHQPVVMINIPFKNVPEMPKPPEEETTTSTTQPPHETTTTRPK